MKNLAPNGTAAGQHHQCSSVFFITAGDTTAIFRWAERVLSGFERIIQKFVQVRVWEFTRWVSASGLLSFFWIKQNECGRFFCDLHVLLECDYHCHFGSEVWFPSSSVRCQSRISCVPLPCWDNTVECRKACKNSVATNCVERNNFGVLTPSCTAQRRQTGFFGHAQKARHFSHWKITKRMFFVSGGLSNSLNSNSPVHNSAGLQGNWRTPAICQQRANEWEWGTLLLSIVMSSYVVCSPCVRLSALVLGGGKTAWLWDISHLWPLWKFLLEERDIVDM